MDTNQLPFEDNLYFGFKLHTWFLIALLIATFLYTRKSVEKFVGFSSHVVTESEYVQDVRNLAYIVGPFLGNIYTYLRAKYIDQTNIPPSGFIPTGINDPTLSDPLLPIARAQIKSWIDSGKALMKKKYDQSFMDSLKNRLDISYTELKQGILEITYTKDGKKELHYL